MKYPDKNTTYVPDDKNTCEPIVVRIFERPEGHVPNQYRRLTPAEVKELELRALQLLAEKRIDEAAAIAVELNGGPIP